jgi:hypothetical protein
LQLEWRAWFLKIVALEIYREKDSRSAVQSIVAALYTRTEEDPDRDYLDTEDMTPRDHRMVMHSLLDALEVRVVPPAPLGQVDELTAELLRMSDLQDCTSEDEYRFNITDVKKLHRNIILANAKLARRSGPAPQSSIENILKYVPAFIIGPNPPLGNASSGTPTTRCVELFATSSKRGRKPYRPCCYSATACSIPQAKMLQKHCSIFYSRFVP